MKKRTKKLLRTLVACGAFSAAPNAFAAGNFSYEPAIVRLSGTVIIQQMYGPSDFGEKPGDKKSAYIGFKLDTPINVAAVSRPPVRPQSDFATRAQYLNQFFDTESVYDVKVVGVDYDYDVLRKLIGRHVTFSGRLFENERAVGDRIILDVGALPLSRDR